MQLELKGVHFLLTYKCDLECDHCFAWGNSRAKGAFTLAQIRNILAEAKKLETVSYVSLEGGEPFLFYPIMVRATEEAVNCGFHVEILSNCYWATSPEDAVEWLRPIAEAKNVELSPSADLYHGEKWETSEVRNAVRAANTLGVKAGIIAIKFPQADTTAPPEIEGAKVGLSELMYKGRAVPKLSSTADKKPWREFVKCPYENLSNPGRVHIDHLGYVHVCQGISIGNAWRKPFSKIIQEYNPAENPILDPLIQGGPVQLIRQFGLPHEKVYADACHMCYTARLLLRDKYPEILGPDEMYGKAEE
jgi:MoaA/NifB/PqqE/SkfB family radical SAM enzyme